MFLRSMIWSATCLLVAGCSSTPAVDLSVRAEQGLADLAVPDQAAPDRLAPGEPVPDRACTPSSLKLEPVADACLVSGPADNINFGAATICNIGVAVGAVGIFRFDLSSLPSTAKIQDLKLRLAYAARAEACATGCGSCDSLEKAGTLQVAFLRSDWPEAHVTWRNRAYNDPSLGPRPWAGPGAGGVGDSSQPVASIAHAVRQEAVFSGGDLLGQLGVWRAGNAVSFRVIPTNGAVFIAAMREQPEKGCPESYPRPLLEISYCP
jgi:hypothetical protein